ncbi:MAG: hypothetical protein AAGK37_02205 [Pseudomonadota bacterium]
MGLHDDPLVQMLTPKLLPKPLAGRITVASQHLLLANAAAILDQDTPLALVLRRQGLDESDVAWRTSLSLASGMIRDRAIEVFGLTPDACETIQDITGRQVTPLPPPPRRSTPAISAIWAPGSERIEIPELGTYLDEDAVSWARLRQKLWISTTPDAPPDCTDLAHFAGLGETALSDEPTGPGQILSVIPNGVGLGHVTRQLAVARRLRQLGATVRFWCYSQAAGLIAKDGFEIIARQTSEHMRMDRSPWTLHEAADLSTFLARSGTRVLIQDAGRISPAVAAALRNPAVGDVRTVLVRRGMWQPGKNRGWRDTEQLCDLVLEPSDLAHAADSGATKEPAPDNRGYARFARVSPVVLTGSDQVMPRAEARREIGISGRTHACLVSLGGDALVSHAGASILIRDAAARAGVKLVWLTSPLATATIRAGKEEMTVQAFPAARLIAAFDGLITAAGYNSFHEALLIGDLPILMVPALHQRLDDQLRRAQFARDKGWCHLLNTKERDPDIAELDAFFASVERGERFKRDIAVSDGASEMAALIADQFQTGERDGARP